ncbi:proton-coupled folate transporter-like isoform X2 [Acanthaster planci]|uniref:Proton-coupled folate transporter n=1 Tax=Acanthaster planci TaxID=133434 RepID=A0A8B7Z3F4_ACAPL|nr:proton-coupled folate transporter-like isoform X2 [Acanthaster planci]
MTDATETELLIKTKPADDNDKRQWDGNRLRASRRWITIEPVIFTCLVAYGTIATLRAEYMRMLVLREHGINSTTGGGDQNCNVNTSSPEYLLEEEIQAETALRVMYLVLCSSGLNILSAPLLSVWSDHAGRKPALFICSFGIWVNTAVYLAVTGFHLSPYYLFIGEAVQGLTGSLILILAVSLAYLADVTTKERRMFRFVVVDTTLFFAIAVAQVAMGYVVKYFGFVPPFVAMCAACGVALLYIIVPTLLLETREKDSSSSSVRQFSDMFLSLVVVFRVKEDNRHIRLALLIVMGFFFTLMFQGALGTSVLLGLGAPICWSTVTVGIFTAVTLFGSCLGLLVAGMTLPRFVKEHWMLYLACLSSLGSYLLTGFASTSLMLFLASAVGCIQNLPGPVIRTMLSKEVSEDEQGVIFAIIGVIESVANFGSPLLLNALYASTVKIYRGLTFFVLAGVTTIPATLIMILHGMSIRKRKMHLKDLKENPAPIQPTS